MGYKIVKELTKQADEYTRKLGKGIGMTRDEKLAELIITECTRICDEVQSDYGQYTFTARICKERIQEEFGVTQ